MFLYGYFILGDRCDTRTDLYDAATDTWLDGPNLKYPIVTPPCMLDLGSSQNMIIAYSVQVKQGSKSYF